MILYANTKCTRAFRGLGVISLEPLIAARTGRGFRAYFEAVELSYRTSYSGY